MDLCQGDVEESLALACLAHMSHEEQEYVVKGAVQCLDLEISTRSTCGDDMATLVTCHPHASSTHTHPTHLIPIFTSKGLCQGEVEFCWALACLAHMDHGEQENEVQLAMQCLDLEISTNRSNLLVGRKLGVEAKDVTIALAM
jgi:hypothetical protein